MDIYDRVLAIFDELDNGDYLDDFLSQETSKMENIIRNAIDTWYASYSPQKYKRTYNFANVKDTVRVRHEGDTVIVSFSNAIMTDYPYASADYVYTGIVEFGYHGSPLLAPPSESVKSMAEKQINKTLSRDHNKYIINYIRRNFK